MKKNSEKFTHYYAWISWYVADYCSHGWYKNIAIKNTENNYYLLRQFRAATSRWTYLLVARYSKPLAIYTWEKVNVHTCTHTHRIWFTVHLFLTSPAMLRATLSVSTLASASVDLLDKALMTAVNVKWCVMHEIGNSLCSKLWQSK